MGCDAIRFDVIDFHRLPSISVVPARDDGQITLSEPRTALRAEAMGRGRGGDSPLKGGVRGSASNMPDLHALRPEASADLMEL